MKRCKECNRLFKPNKEEQTYCSKGCYIVNSRRFWDNTEYTFYDIEEPPPKGEALLFENKLTIDDKLVIAHWMQGGDDV